MSSLSLRTSLRNVALMIVVGIGANAHADKVNWGQYLESPGASKPIAIKHASMPAPAAKRAAKPTAKAAPHKAAARKKR
jgi:hypothetical protein